MLLFNNSEKKALKFIDGNGAALAQRIVNNVSAPLDKLGDIIWDILGKCGQQNLFSNKGQAINGCFCSLIAIRIELEMRAVETKFGPTAYKRLSAHIAAYIMPVIGEDLFLSLMKEAYEILEANRGKLFDGEDFDIILSELFNNVFEPEKKISPLIFYPLIMILENGEHLDEIISKYI